LISAVNSAASAIVAASSRARLSPGSTPVAHRASATPTAAIAVGTRPVAKTTTTDARTR
jgi:hypothetical protein